VHHSFITVLLQRLLTSQAFRHIATPLVAGAIRFASLDTRQRKVASLNGLKIVPMEKAAEQRVSLGNQEIGE
jgi:hypothetical protein